MENNYTYKPNNIRAASKKDRIKDRARRTSGKLRNTHEDIKYDKSKTGTCYNMSRAQDVKIREWSLLTSITKKEGN